ncbi:BtrH N-terminal domain-containing protein [Sinanaerobacter chloroacetimidivorans]|jgi:hypothetical protein|uniref:Uncharacterized protein n=1 Tax=Sinanaerobacter chloroacetimidivorans TaxID=2818044 RepID=A0A8J7W138_9FIRM|nr:BtrH N-terminal domain-containing protein [Sinanaerobacter chloroacetimidivorans]MBR0598874.1 hypothetical protein [Sinanaerobacter chloroacetimidivorans]
MIKRELNFPIVYQNGRKIGYGGNQEWFPHLIKRKAGCGCTTGANLAVYYAANHEKMAGIYDGDTRYFDIKEYLSAMEEMFTYMRPGLFGFPYVKKFANQFIRFCKDHGISLEASFCNSYQNAEEAFCYVKQNIDDGQPIALLILFHRAYDLREDNWHWVTITGYTLDGDGLETAEIIMSNCGERETVKAVDLFEVHRINKIRMVSFHKISEYFTNNN